MTTGRINQIAIPTDEPEDKSVAMKQAPFSKVFSSRDLETGAARRFVQRRIVSSDSLSLSEKRGTVDWTEAQKDHRASPVVCAPESVNCEGSTF